MKRVLNLLFLLFMVLFGNAQNWSKTLEKSAKKGNTEAQVKVGDAYFTGSGVPRDLKKAAKWYSAATAQGSEEGKQKLYSFYSKELEKFAKKGDVQAQYEVGCDYLLGKGVDKDVKTAVKWFLLAMEQNHEEAVDKFYSFYSKELEKRAKENDTRAQFELGNCYLNGIEVETDPEEAAEWYLKAMEQDHDVAREKFYSYYSKKLLKRAKDGDDRAQFEIGNCFFKGNGVDKDTEEASEWYLKAMAQGHEEAGKKFYSFYSKELEKRAKKGDVLAQFEVGNGYYDGFIIKKDLKEASEWYLKAMEQGHEEAAKKFYSFYSKELEKRAKRGDVEAQFAVGNCYYNGNNVDKDIKVASEWYFEAMGQGHEEAKAKFYSFYSKQLEKRAKQGDVLAQFEVGNCYFDGKQVEKDREIAAEWYMRAMSQGHEEAKIKFYSFYSKQLLKKAKDNDAEAQYQMGEYCFNGKGVDRDTEKAAEWYLEALKQGHEDAKTKFYSFYSKELERRAKDGDAEAQYVIGEGYLKGIRVKKDTEEAAKWFLSAMDQNHEASREMFYSFYSKRLEKKAKEGDSRAQFEVGNGYFEGTVVKKDLEEAAEWYLKAMFQEHEGAKEKFYSFYSEVLKKRAKAGDVRAQYEMGNFFLNGNVVKKDVEEAAEWYLKAKTQEHEGAEEKFYSFYSKVLEKEAKDGDIQAQYEVGNFYFDGVVVKKDIETAAEWYLRAKESGHEDAKEKFYSFYSKILAKSAKNDVEALYRIGSYYMDGRGVDKNEKKGAEMLLEAHEKGHPEAFNKFGSVYNKMLQKMGKKGDSRANLAIAKCYLNGSGIEKNVSKAAELLKTLVEDAECGEEAAKILESIGKE
ncbi:MAG: SEL1-like repeat protein [Lachnospiraceae bacterium]|nr:SEL1-like repeat protein [Lachnospiraceae bacterium]